MNRCYCFLYRVFLPVIHKYFASWG